MIQSGLTSITAAIATIGAIAPGGTEVPALPDPASLVGDWIIVDGPVHCQIRLTDRPRGQDLSAIPDARCRLWAPGVAAWRRTSDGLALATAEGRTLFFLPLIDDGSFRIDTPMGRTVTMRRR